MPILLSMLQQKLNTELAMRYFQRRSGTCFVIGKFVGHCYQKFHCWFSAGSELSKPIPSAKNNPLPVQRSFDIGRSGNPCICNGGEKPITFWYIECTSVYGAPVCVGFVLALRWLCQGDSCVAVLTAACSNSNWQFKQLISCERRHVNRY